MPSKQPPAATPVEIEAKIQVASFVPVRRRIASHSGRLLNQRALERNALFDSADRSVTSAAKSLRVRAYGKRGSITLKGRPTVDGGLKSRAELETEVKSPEVLTQILVSLGYAPQFRYEKYREVWKVGRCVVCLDETPLGRFVEVEGAPAEIYRVADLLGLSPSRFLSASYPSLWFGAGRTGDMVFASGPGRTARK